MCYGIAYYKTDQKIQKTTFPQERTFITYKNETKTLEKHVITRLRFKSKRLKKFRIFNLFC